MARRVRTTDRTASEAATPLMRLRPWDEVAKRFNLLTGESIGRTGAEFICRRAERKIRAALEAFVADAECVAE